MGLLHARAPVTDNTPMHMVNTSLPPMSPLSEFIRIKLPIIDRRVRQQLLGFPYLFDYLRWSWWHLALCEVKWMTCVQHVYTACRTYEVIAMADDKEAIFPTH